MSVQGRRKRLPIPSGISPFQMIELSNGFRSLVPSVTEFVVSDAYLNRPYLYPRQATLLKVMFLQSETFCVDEQTEILTRRGWLRHEFVIEGDQTLALRQDGQAEWVPVERMNRFPVVDEPMVRMQGRGHSSLTTPNHRWLVERLYQDQSNPRRESEFVETRDLRGSDRIACAAPVDGLPVEPMWPDAFVELVAWYWTEGHQVVGGQGATIVQSDRVNPDEVASIRRCLTELFGEAVPSLWDLDGPGWCAGSSRPENGCVVFRLNEHAARDLFWVAPGAEKVVEPGFLAQLTQEQLELFIDVSMRADGHIPNKGKYRGAITQKSKGRLDSFQMACSLAGLRSNLRLNPVGGQGPYQGRDRWALSLMESHRHFTPKAAAAGNTRTFAVEQEGYTGVVWCPTTRHGTWLARRDGMVYFTGNTDYDHEVIGEWIKSYKDTANDQGEGNNGIVPDVYERIRINRQCPCGHDKSDHADGRLRCSSRVSDVPCLCRNYRGRPWFRQTENLSGRRGGKGHIGGLAGAYVLWNFMSWGDVQGHFGIDRDKQLEALVFAGKKEQARANQWKDLTNIILGATCFTNFIASPLGESLTIYAPNDYARMLNRRSRGIDGADDMATFVIKPKESTLMAARGPAAFMHHYDEFAHVVATGANRAAEDVWDAATPSLDQFKEWAFIYIPTSPWQKIGQAYVEYQQTLEVEEDGSPTYPEKLMVQLTSWDIYKDWERSSDLFTEPGGIRFLPLRGAVQEYDEGMQRLERANPDTFRVERRSWWATALNAYLAEDKVQAMWEPYNGVALTQQTQGILSRSYRAHGDPSKSGANFGFSIAHIDGYDERGLPHVVFDVIHAWIPGEFEDGEIDYDEVGTELEGYIETFMPTEMTFDQFNCLDGDTLLFTESGLRTVKDLAGDLPVGQVRDIDLGIQSREEVSRVRQVYRRGPAPVRRLTTKLGAEVSVTPEHRMWVRKGKAQTWHQDHEWGWLTADQIEVGDWLCVKRDNLLASTEVDLTDLHPEYNWRQDHSLSRLSRYPKTCDEALGFLLGAMVAEGKCVAGRDCAFSNSNRDYMSEVQSAWEHTFGGEWEPRWLPATDQWSERGVIQAGGNVAGFLYSLGCSGISQEKVVPWVVMQSPRPVVAAFLRGLFEGDGGVQVHDSAGEWVHFTSTSRDLACQTQQLLLGLGVFSTLWSGHYTYQGEMRNQYRVKVSGPDILDYQRHVGFVSEHKMGLLTEAVSRVLARGDKAGLRSKHRRVGDEFWVRVTAIEESEADCYDISVPGPECFLANGIVSHNSVNTIQRLRRYVTTRSLPKRTTLYERTATGPLNWKTFETFKTALNMGLVHAPYHELADLELRFLQDLGGKVEKPTSGPVQTKDIADCYHSHMEVLTEHGWMLIKDVPRGIKVATRSPEGWLEYQEPTDYIARHHTGVMYEYDSNRLNFSVTPGHRMLVQRDGGVEFIEAQDLSATQYRIPKTAVVEDRTPNTISFDTEDTTAAQRRVVGRGGARNEAGWTQEQDDYLREHYSTASMTDLCAVLGKTRGAIYNRAKPKNLDLKRGQIGDRIGDRPAPLPETKVEDFAAFLGIWLAEGRKMRDKRGYDVKITQTKPDGIEWINNLFQRLPWPVRRTVQKNGETVWVVKSRGLREYLRACQGEGHELLIPDEVFTTWTKREMEQLLEGLLVGDGCWSNRRARHTGYSTSSRRLADDVQRLLAHVGLSGWVHRVEDSSAPQRPGRYATNHDGWFVSVRESQHATLHTERLKQVEYDDMVYCLTVPNSTLLVRRNGVPMWAGNCIAINVYELIGEQMSMFIGQQLSALPLGAGQPGGINPYAGQEDAIQQLSGFSRARRHPGAGGPTRGRPR